MKFLFRIGCLLGLFFAVFTEADRAHAQATLAGTVVDAETGAPLPGATVFIAASMIGTATDAAGRYRLAAVPPGAHRVFVSLLGYEPARRDTLLRPGAHTLDFRLAPAPVQIAEVVVTAERNAVWQRRLKRFERLFLGETPNAAQTRLQNPEVLDFAGGGWGRFVARAAAPLVVENRALGYRVTYYLKEFVAEGGALRYDGEPLFEPLTPASAEEAARWDANRRTAYHGSLRHFLLSLLGDTSRAAGFDVYLLPDREAKLRTSQRMAIAPRQLLRDAATATEKTLDFFGALEVLYREEEVADPFLRWMYGTTWTRDEAQRSWIELSDGPTQIDHTGEVVEPYGVTVFGYFAFERIADELPKEYRP